MDNFPAYPPPLDESNKFVQYLLGFFLCVAVQVDIGNNRVIAALQAFDVVLTASVFAE